MIRRQLTAGELDALAAWQFEANKYSVFSSRYGAPLDLLRALFQGTIAWWTDDGVLVELHCPSLGVLRPPQLARFFPDFMPPMPDLRPYGVQ